MQLLKTIYQRSCQTWIIGLVITGFLVLLIGGFGQYLSLAHHQPFGTPVSKAVVISLLWLIYTFCFLQVKPAKPKVPAEAEHKATELESIFPPLFTQVMAEIKQNVSNKLLPSVLVLGAEGSGKKGLLRHTETALDTNQALIKPELANMFIDLKLTGNTLFLVAANRFACDRPEAEQAWEPLARLVAQRLTKKSLRTVVITYSLGDLLQQTDEQLIEQTAVWRQRVRVLQENLGYYPSVHIIVTQMDRLAGFKEFFADLTEVEKQQTWGVFLQQDADFAKQYDELLTRLNHMVLHRLQQINDEESRILAADFPIQMTSIKARLLRLLKSLRQPNKYAAVLQVNGLYFTSALQQGEPLDYVMGQLTAEFNLQQQPFTNGAQSREAYFIKHLWDQIVSNAQTQVIPTYQATLKLQRWTLASYMVMTVVFIALGTILYGSYKINKEQLSSLANGITNYRQLARAGEANAAMQQLAQVAAVLKNRHSWLNQVGFQQASIAAKNYDAAYQQQLQQILLPALLAVLEKTLQEDLQQPTQLYRTLKAYLMFGNPDHMQANYIRDWFKHFLYQGMGKILPETAVFQNAIADLTAKPIPAQQLNNALIHQARQVLNTITLGQRTYNALQQQTLVAQLPSVSLDSNRMTGFEQVFSAINSAINISGFYTVTGYQQAYLKLDKSMAQTAQSDSWVFGEQDNINAQPLNLQQQIQSLYFTDYITYWDSMLNQLRLKHFTKLQQATEAVKLLVNPVSPMQQFLLLVVDNTYIADKQATQSTQQFNNAVSPYFSALQQFIQADAKQPVSLVHLQQQLLAIYNELTNLQAAKDVPQACFVAAKGLVNQDANNPLVLLQQQAAQYPQPVSGWLNDLLNQIAGLIFQQAQIYLSQQWQDQVYAPYNQRIQYHYPFGIPSQPEVIPDDFTKFFGPQGILNKFVADYLQDFIDISVNPWQLRSFAGQSLLINADNVNALQQAKSFTKLFSTAEGKVNGHFNLTPIDMSAQVSEAQLYIGNQQLRYRHDPQLPTQINWPSDNLRISMQLIDLNGERSTVAFTGNWAVFKWLQACRMQTQSSAEYLVKCKVNERNISYILQADRSDNLFNQLEVFSLWSLSDRF